MEPKASMPLSGWHSWQLEPGTIPGSISKTFFREVCKSDPFKAFHQKEEAESRFLALLRNGDIDRATNMVHNESWDLTHSQVDGSNVCDWLCKSKEMGNKRGAYAYLASLLVKRGAPVNLEAAIHYLDFDPLVKRILKGAQKSGQLETRLKLDACKTRSNDNNPTTLVQLTISYGMYASTVYLVKHMERLNINAIEVMNYNVKDFFSETVTLHAKPGICLLHAIGMATRSTDLLEYVLRLHKPLIETWELGVHHMLLRKACQWPEGFQLLMKFLPLPHKTVFSAILSGNMSVVECAIERLGKYALLKNEGFARDAIAAAFSTRSASMLNYIMSLTKPYVVTRKELAQMVMHTNWLKMGKALVSDGVLSAADFEQCGSSAWPILGTLFDSVSQVNELHRFHGNDGIPYEEKEAMVRCIFEQTHWDAWLDLCTALIPRHGVVRGTLGDTVVKTLNDMDLKEVLRRPLQRSRVIVSQKINSYKKIYELKKPGDGARISMPPVFTLIYENLPQL